MEGCPIFIEVLPEFDAIKDGELWISHKHRTINLRCPCGCGELTVLTLHPSRWHVYFDGKSVSLDGPTGGSVWAVSGCGSHYVIRKNTVIWREMFSVNYFCRRVASLRNVTETLALGVRSNQPNQR